MSVLGLASWEAIARQHTEIVGWTPGSAGSQRAELSGEEQARQLMYLIRSHYASTDSSANGREKCPLYYSSIEGIIGNSAMNLAELKGLPVPGAPADFRMIDLFNCFGSTEKLITREFGPMQFVELVDRNVTVLTEKGWEPATVSSFGQQTVQRVTFAPRSAAAGGFGANSNIRRSVVVTPNHRWILLDGTETQSLSVGDSVRACANPETWKNGSVYDDGFLHGLVFADGSADYQRVGRNQRTYRIRLCGKKAEHVGKFKHAVYPPSCGGEPIAYVESVLDLKQVPPAMASSDYLRGFVAGWCVGDGTVRKDSDGSARRNGAIILCTQNDEAVRWLEENAALAGYVMNGLSVRSSMETNYGRRSHPLRHINLVRAEYAAWKVVAIEALDEPEEVYCATVPGSAAFTLASGIYTGNCFPMAIRADTACILNEFSWERLQIKVDGKVDEPLSQLARNIVRESVRKKSWTLTRFMVGGGSRGDCYIRPRPDKKFQTGVRWDLCQAEGTHPRLSMWNTSVADSYRFVYSIARDLPSDVTLFPKAEIPKDDVVEVVSKDGVQVYVNDEPVDIDDEGNRVSGENPKGLEEPAVAHLAYRESDTFYGIPAIDSDSMDLIDEANVAASSLKQVEMSFGQPTLAMIGLNQTEAEAWRWGRRNIIGIPLEGDMKFVSFENLDQLIQIVQMFPATIRDKVVQFVLKDLQSGNTGESGIALEYRLFPYTSYLGPLEGQLRDAIGKALEIALKILKKWPVDAEVEVLLDFGARFPVDVAARLSQTKAQTDVFGKSAELIEELARREKFSDATVKAIVRDVKRDNEAGLQQKETEAHGGGFIGANQALKLREDREKRRAEEGA
jgi:hypothetical protein